MRRTDQIEFSGETMTVLELCELHGVPWMTAHNREFKGCPVIKACTTPVNRALSLQGKLSHANRAAQSERMPTGLSRPTAYPVGYTRGNRNQPGETK